MEYHEPLVKHHETLVKHHETIENAALNVMISALNAAIAVLGTWHGVSGDCSVGITPQMSNRVTPWCMWSRGSWGGGGGGKFTPSIPSSIDFSF